MNTYASLNAPLPDVLHGAARLHVALARMEGLPISTRGWSFNGLVDGIVHSGCASDPGVRQSRALGVMLDTLDAVCEIGPAAVDYLLLWRVK